MRTVDEKVIEILSDEKATVKVAFYVSGKLNIRKSNDSFKTNLSCFKSVILLASENK